MILSAVFYQDRMHIYIRTGRFPLNYRAWIAKFFRGSAPDPIVAYFHMDLKLIPSPPPTQKYAPASLLVMHYNCSRLSLKSNIVKRKGTHYLWANRAYMQTAGHWEVDRNPSLMCSASIIHLP